MKTDQTASFAKDCSLVGLSRYSKVYTVKMEAAIRNQLTSCKNNSQVAPMVMVKETATVMVITMVKQEQFSATYQTCHPEPLD